MKFDGVRKEEADTVLKLYRSSCWERPTVCGQKTTRQKKRWNLIFPEMSALFCMRDDDGNIIGVISIDDDPNVECLTCSSENHGAVSRSVPGVGVTRNFRAENAQKLLVGVMEELKNRGYQAVHLLVAKDNVKALRSYDKLNFRAWESANSGDICTGVMRKHYRKN